MKGRKKAADKFEKKAASTKGAKPAIEATGNRIKDAVRSLKSKKGLAKKVGRGALMAGAAYGAGKLVHTVQKPISSTVAEATEGLRYRATGYKKKDTKKK